MSADDCLVRAEQRFHEMGTDKACAFDHQPRQVFAGHFLLNFLKRGQCRLLQTPNFDAPCAQRARIGLAFHVDIDAIRG